MVLPEKVAPGEPMQLSSAAVFIKHQPVLDPDVASPKIKRMVASSIPGLADGEQDNIAIVFMPAQTITHQYSTVSTAIANQALPVKHAPLLYNLLIAVLVLIILSLITVGRESFRKWLVQLLNQRKKE